MEELMEILKKIKPEVDFETETDLIEDGLLESFEMLQIIARIKDTFCIEVKPSRIVPENFASAEAMWNMINDIMENE